MVVHLCRLHVWSQARQLSQPDDTAAQIQDEILRATQMMPCSCYNAKSQGLG